MRDTELRALIRDAVARHLGQPMHEPAPGLGLQTSDSATRLRDVPGASDPAWRQHPSHHLHVTVLNTDDACIIEPSVRCDHCGYCKSHGH